MARRIQVVVPEAPIPEAAAPGSEQKSGLSRDGDFARSIEDLKRT